jgi:peptidoglycan/xylan/chitin deacetylase (PgdA/CDA1 family)
MIDIIKDAISLACYPASALFGNKGETVLVYHSIERTGSPDTPHKINLRAPLFEEQIKSVSRSGKRDMIVTFDDGFGNFFDNAFPVILRYNIKTILFITTDFIDGKMSFDAFFGGSAGVKPLSWRQIKEISGSGVEIGSHTLSHPDLTKLSRDAAYREISESKKKIEDATGRKVRYFAYPFGSARAFNGRIKQLVKESGYERAYTNIMGFNGAGSDPYELRRIRVYSNDNMFRFKMKVKGAYNWVDSVNILGVKR